MELKPHFDILIPGNYYCDIIFTGLPGFPQLGAEIYAKQLNIVPGGGALNTTVALHRLGINAGWITQLGNDLFSQFIHQFLQSEGIDMSLITQLQEPLQRVTVALSYPQDRAFVSYIDPSPKAIELALDALDRVTFRHLHLTSLTVDSRVPMLLETCHERGITVSMDCQHREETITMPLVRDILSRVDVFMPNATEAQRITQTQSANEALRVLSEFVPFVVVKSGDQGAIACKSGLDYQSPAIASSVVDTTGAGDVFNAGFLAAFVQGKPVNDCLRWGNFCGGMSVRGLGGTAAAPTRKMLNQWLDDVPMN